MEFASSTTDNKATLHPLEARADTTGFQLSDLDMVLSQFSDDCVCVITGGEEGERDMGYIVDTRTVFQSPVLRKLLLPVQWDELCGMVDIEGHIVTPTGQVLAFLYPGTREECAAGIETLFSSHVLSRRLAHAAHAIDMLCIDEARLIDRSLDPLIESIRQFKLEREELTDAEWKIIVVNSTVLRNYADLEKDLNMDDISPDVEAALCNAKESHYEMFSPYNRDISRDLVSAINYLVQRESTWPKLLKLMEVLVRHDQGIYTLLGLARSDNWKQKLWPVAALSGMKVLGKPINSSDLLNSMLARLCSFEVRSITRRMEHGLTVDVGDPFVLTLGQAVNLFEMFGSKHRFEAKDFTTNLNAYVGGFLADLDLSNCMITGSAIPAALLGKKGTVCTHERMMTQYSPWRFTVKRVIKSANASLRLTPSIRVHLTVISETTARLVIGTSDDAFIRDASFVVDLEMTEGADLDIAVNSLDPAVIEAEAKKVLAVVEKHCSGVATMTTVQKQVGILFKISARPELKYSDPYKFFSFRPIEVYGSSLARIWTHHVAPVRAAYTSVFGKTELYLSATAAAVYGVGKTHQHYWYFASGKTTPAAVIAKYMNRGFELTHPALLDDAIEKELSGPGGSCIYAIINSIGKASGRLLSHVSAICNEKDSWWNEFTAGGHGGVAYFGVEKSFLPVSTPMRIITCKYPLGPDRTCGKTVYAHDVCIEHWVKCRPGKCTFIGVDESTHLARVCNAPVVRGQRFCNSHYKHMNTQAATPVPPPPHPLQNLSNAAASPLTRLFLPEGSSGIGFIGVASARSRSPTPIEQFVKSLAPQPSATSRSQPHVGQFAMLFEPQPEATPVFQPILAKTCQTQGCIRPVPLAARDGKCNVHSIECMFWDNGYCPNPRLGEGTAIFCGQHTCIVFGCTNARITQDGKFRTHCHEHAVNTTHGCTYIYEDGSVCGNLILSSTPTGIRTCSEHDQAVEKLAESVKLSKMED